MSAAENKAVFLSYASQDAAAVLRICEALRASGVEVWFDQNELVGGDAWDAKIRGQIASCALFVPVISAATQARREGYFRIEWKLAAQRTHAMADGTPFLLPVVIDATRDTEALVPAEFRAVQWTRLPGADSPEKFCARVQHLLSGSTSEPGRPRPGPRGVGDATQPRSLGRRVPVAAWIGVLSSAAIIGVFAVWQPWKTLAPPSTDPVSPPAASAPVSAARKLVAQARPLFDSGDYVNREDVFLAEDLLKKAQALDNTDAEVWAAQGDLSRQMIILGYERTSSRLELLRQQSERAYKLDPNSMASQISYAGYLQWAGKESAKESVRLMEALLSRAPDNRKAYRVLGMAWSYAGDIDQAMEACRRSNALTGGDPVALMMGAAQLQWWGRYAEIESALEQADAEAVTGRSHVLRVLVDLFWHGDTDRAVASLEKWPLWMQREDRGAFVASQVWLWRREPDRAIAVLSPIARDAFYDTYYTGPKAVLLALAHEMAGRPQAARAEWENAKRVATRMVAEQPSLKRTLTLKAVAMAKLGEIAGAEAILRSLELAGDLRSEYWSSAHPSALLRVTLDRADELATRLATESMVDMVAKSFPAPRAALQLNPVYDTVRATPAFQRLMAAAPAPAKKRENASLAPVANDKSALADKSLVVLPLENLSPDPENAFFTDGMHQEIIATLQRISDLTVISRDSAMTFKGSTASLLEKAQKVAAAHVITGSVRRAGTQVRVQLELRRARDEALLWTQTYDKELGQGVIAIQSDIADQVARVLQARERKGTYAGAQFMTANPEAYDAFLKASQILYADRTRTGHAKAVGGLEQALVLDPKFSSAAHLLTIAKVTAFRATSDPAARLRHARDAKRWAEEARRLLPGGAADAALASYYSLIEPDNARSLALVENAVKSLPSDGAIHNMMAIVLGRAGRVAEAVEVSRRAIALDPPNQVFHNNLLLALSRLRRVGEFAAAEPDYIAVADPATSRRPLHDYHWRLAGSLPPTLEPYSGVELADWLVRARRDTEALPLIEAELSAATGSEVERWQNWIRKCDGLRRLQREPEALAAAQAAQASLEKINAEPEFDVSERDLRVAVTQARLGRAGEAIAAGRRYVSARSPENQVSARWQRDTELAEIYAYLNRPRECCELLAKLLLVPSGLTVPMLTVDPIWDNVREDAAFKALLADPKNSAPL
jgi:TolB-like protein/Flp pilus assembly protein TadD